ncbi:ABC transporter permease subunit [Falsiroseomonas stagni]|uniref:Putative spermidine/putrescine transport system permease protein n=1 Tax=Falsiroseomonas stagni DSM 19981 TaxID=1123062 RepID=A0A1I4C8L7_9PROT|nr:ABC transporter permease subunit [Falsiroseomonas stagni]SFK77504.1 putative spermidine/putrescine transport system permease protein [Falsiroseomonas stagni DSM 19981]
MNSSPRAGWLALPYGLWLLAAFAAPLGAVALLSVQESSEMFAPLSLLPSGAQYAELLGDRFYVRVFLNTIWLGLGVAAASTFLAYPLALWLTRLPPRWKPVGFAVVLVPLLTNVVVRSLGIILLLAPRGIVSGIGQFFGLPPSNLLFGWFAVGLALTQVFLPYMVLALYDVLDGQDKRLEEAAAGLGAGPAMRFLRVILPLSLPGLRAGLTVTFLMASTAYVSATLVGGRKVWVSGMVVLKEGMEILNYPLAAALAMMMLGASVVVTILIGRAIGFLTPWVTGRAPRFRLSLPPGLRRPLVAVAEAAAPVVSRFLLALAIGVLIFPLLLVAVASVNDSPQATVAQFVGFTWKWYGMVLQNERYLSDAWVSVKLALACVAISLAIALPASFALVRAGFRGREVLGAALMLPLALPGIAIGLGMLRLLQWFTALPPFMGVLAVHVVLVAPFMLALLRASVAGLDRTLEEAASGLGAPPARVFRKVILPQLGPGIAVACVIGFLLSFGEVTVTAFLTTARLQTLPVRIYAESTFSLENTVNAISTIFILMTVAMLILVNRFMPLDRVWKR